MANPPIRIPILNIQAAGNSIATWDALNLSRVFIHRAAELLRRKGGSPAAKSSVLYAGAGQTLAQCTSALNAIVLTNNPDVLVINGGENNRATAEATYKAFYLSWVDSALAKARLYVLCLTPWPEYDVYKGSGPATGSLAQWQRDVIQAHADYDRRLFEVDISGLRVADGPIVAGTTNLDGLSKAGFGPTGSGSSLRTNVNIAADKAITLWNTAPTNPDLHLDYGAIGGFYLVSTIGAHPAVLITANTPRAITLATPFPDAEGNGQEALIAQYAGWTRLAPRQSADPAGAGLNYGYGTESHPTDASHYRIGKAIVNKLANIYGLDNIV